MPVLTAPNAVSVPVWGPASGLVAITPSDTTDLGNNVRALWVGTGGNLAVKPIGGGAAVTLSNVPDGTLLPIMVGTVMATNTTASNIVGLT